jgi:hypothetical protein
MGKPNVRFIARAEAGTGWRIWDRQQHRWWGEPQKEYPSAILTELNSEKRPDRIVELTRKRIAGPQTL